MKHAGTRAFTLIELLVVIGIISVLIAIGLTVAVTVTNTGRAQATKSTMLALEGVQQALDAETDFRPKDYKEYRATVAGEEVWFPIIDARLEQSSVDRTSVAIPSLGRFLKFAGETVAGIDRNWTQLDASIVRAGDIGNSAAFGPGGGRPVPLAGTEVLDTWGNPIRFVHPSFDGGSGEWYDSEGSSSSRDSFEVPTGSVQGGGASPQAQNYRRSFRPFNPDSPPAGVGNPVGDADEGICPGGQPYLYSAGPDGDPGTRADNVYASVTPEYPSETASQD